MRRDNVTIVRNDNFAWSFDTFHDHRNGVLFEVKPHRRAVSTGQVTNESQVNIDWNPIWDFATGYFDGGYVVEAAIPFKSLRYPPGPRAGLGFPRRAAPTAGRTRCRTLRRCRPRSSTTGHFRSSLSAAVVGLEAPPASRLVEIKPYAIGDVSSDLAAAEPFSNRFGGSGGFDVKYGITQNLTADFTVNTDFAQVEADEQQVNLTRFSLFFPEKREFFLENQDCSPSGGAGAGPFGTGDTPVLFYSRNIGLDHGREIPIDAGARMTGRVGRVQRRRTEHPHRRPRRRRGSGGGGRGHELLGRAHQARPAAAQQHRRESPRAGLSPGRPGDQPRRTAPTPRSASTTR